MSNKPDAPKRYSDIEGFSPDAKALKSMKRFAYKSPDRPNAKRAFCPLVRSDIVLALVQKLYTGGEPELHSHSALDGFWFVLSGKVRFYGADREVFAEAGKHEGVFVPRGVAYWFEQVGEEPLEILQVEAIDPRIKSTITRYDEHKEEVLGDFYDTSGELVAADIDLRNA